MADDPNNPNPGASAAPTITVPADYESLREFHERYGQYGPALDLVRDNFDTIRPLLEDENEREFYTNARKAREAVAPPAPTMSPEMQAFRDDLRKEFGPTLDWVGSQREAAEKKIKDDEVEKYRAQEASNNANRAYAQRIIAEQPKIFGFVTDEAGSQVVNPNMKRLVAMAAAEGLSVEDAYKNFGAELFGVKPRAVEREKPPASLRGDTAAPGVPGESTEPPIRTKGQLAKRLANNLRAAGMKG